MGDDEETLKGIYFVYSVHSSGTFFMIPSLEVRLYLILLRFHAHRYEDASNLIDGLFLDSPLSNLQRKIIDSALAFQFRTADAILCLLKFYWKLADNFYTKASHKTQIFGRYASVSSYISETSSSSR